MTYAHEDLGDEPSVLQKIVSGEHEFSKKWKSAKKPLIIVGSETLERPDGGAILSSVQTLAAGTSCENKDWRVLNILHKVASQVSKIIIQQFKLMNILTQTY